MTMQTFVVLFTGVALGARYGFIALSFYILEGALGFQYFQEPQLKGLGSPIYLVQQEDILLDLLFQLF